MTATRWMVPGRDSALIDPADRGLQYGDGLFETIAVRAGKARFIERHLARLKEGCMRLAIDTDALAAVEESLRKLIGDEPSGTLKIVVTRGAGPRGYRPAGTEVPTLLLGFTREKRATAPAPEAGVAAIICRTRLGRNAALAGMKTLNRLEQVIARLEWNRQDIFEGVMLDEAGLLIGGTMSNLFLVRHGRLMTPALEHCGVRGVMRSVVLEQASAAAIETEESSCPAELLDDAEEMFVTNSLIGMRPVVRMAERRLDIGPITRVIASRVAACGVMEAGF